MITAVICFSGAWCGPCVSQKAHWDEFVRNYKGPAQLVYVDVDENESPAYRRFGKLWEKERHVPLVVWLDSKGQAVHQESGSTPTRELLRWSTPQP
jgi:thiol-disulfide isomerase/thioredoxin